MPYKSKAERKLKARQYYLAHKEQFREYYEAHREHLLECQRMAEPRRRRKYRKMLLSSFNFGCLSCNKSLMLGKKMYAFHEINGIDHSADGSSIYYYKKEAGRFVPLCKDCHKTFHVLMSLGKDFEEILSFIGWKVV